MQNPLQLLFCGIMIRFFVFAANILLIRHIIAAFMLINININ